MATLKEAVESGRRWRWKGDPRWRAAGLGLDSTSWTTFQALSSDFEIEPEPEKPREWVGFANKDGNLVVNSHQATDGYYPVRLHDADACDRSKPIPEFQILANDFEYWMDAYAKWRDAPVGAALELTVAGPPGKLIIRRKW